MIEVHQTATGVEHWTVSTTEYTTASARLIGTPICPDLLDYEAIGVADNARGRIVRAFFWLMRVWPV